MAFQITIQPSGHTCTAAPGMPILRAALDAGLLLPYGCRNGACGACKGRLVSGSIDYGDADPSALSEADKTAGLALFCCAQPLSDIVIESRELAPESEFPVRTLPARVQKMALLAPDVMVLSLKLPASERLQFLAGQYIEILLKDGRRRAFSLANAPHEDGLLQLHVRRVPGGQFTGQVFETMKERDILRFEGPHGDFFLRTGSAKPVILLAGGTGFAPIKAIVEQALHEGSERLMTLYWGARDRTGLYLPELPRQWAAAHPQFRYVEVLEDASDELDGTRHGLVHHAVLKDFPDLSDHQVYACGAPAMIAAAQRDFLAHQLPEEEFFADAFSFAADR